MTLVANVVVKCDNEPIIRQLCSALVKFAKINTPIELKLLNELNYLKMLMKSILNKISKVATLLTQQALLGVFFLHSRVTDDGGTRIFMEERVIIDSNYSEYAFHLFQQLDINNFFIVSNVTR